ncbi:MAG TPA: substrate-binding domain-containing protein [Polyangiaceae bacterium]|jgi:molybdate-binding protein/DNA-binding XRE family transcriptional regulator
MASRVRARREQLELPQQDLAALAGVSRQTLGAIEAGRSVPSVDVAVRIASALGVSVEALFGAEGSWSISAEKGTPTPSGRCVLAMCHGRWVVHSLGDREHDVAADGVRVAGSRTIQLFRPPAVARENVLVMGCAPALGVLGDRLNAERGPGRFVWLPNRSNVGFDALLARKTHVAGLHLTDEKGREANTKRVKGASSAMKVTLVTLGHWEVGLVVARGNPKRIRRASDVARRGIRLVNREIGASPRRVLERRLKAEGTPAPADSATVDGHRNVARVVAAEAADVGPAVRDVAIAFGLDFVPFGEERFDLALPTEMLSAPEVRRLLDTLASARARAELSALGYDVRETGNQVLLPS